jgi:8-oxo-dGTP pyrophosphatase MutT (NUDIX family)/GNAT superfamily N-acetyltransferase
MSGGFLHNGELHINGGIKFQVDGNGRTVELEKDEAIITNNAFETEEVKTYEGTNIEILEQINTEAGGKSMSEQADAVESGDVVICRRSAADKKKRKITGTPKQVASAVNESCGCRKIEDGAVVSEKFRNGGKINLQDRYNAADKNTEIIYVSTKKILDKHEKDEPSYTVRKKENQIGNRVGKAKQFIEQNWNNQEIYFEPSRPYINPNTGKLSFEDGRHRIKAAEDLGIKIVAVEIPKEQVIFFKNLIHKRAAGALVVAKDTGRILLLKRSADEKNDPNVWACVGGGVENEETYEQGVIREAQEEIGYTLDNFKLVYTHVGDYTIYKNFLSFVETEFEPKLNYEHSDFGWFELNELPTPLHFGLNDLFETADIDTHIAEQFEKGGEIKLDFCELNNKELRNTLLSFWSDFMLGYPASYLSIKEDDYVLDSIKNILVLFRKENFSVVEKKQINKLLNPYFDNNSKPAFSNHFERFEVKDNKIFIYLKNLYKDGGEIEQYKETGVLELKFYATTSQHAKEYGIECKNPLYLKSLCVKDSHRLKGIGKKALQYIDNYAKENNYDVIFGHISQKAEFTKDERQSFFCDVELIKYWLHEQGYAINPDNNDFHKVISLFEKGGSVSEIEYELPFFNHLEQLENNYLQTSQTRIDEYYEQGEPERNQRKVLKPIYYVTWDYDGSSGSNADRKFKSIKQAFDYTKTPDTFVNAYSSHHFIIDLYFNEIWIDENGYEVEETKEFYSWGDVLYNLESEAINELKKQIGDETVIYFKDYGARENKARELLSDVYIGIKNDAIKEYRGYSIEFPEYVNKYNNLWIYDKQKNQVLSIQLRISDHSYNPRNNDTDAQSGKFISVEIANTNETRGKFGGNYSLHFDEDNTYDEVIEAVNERIKEIIENFLDFEDFENGGEITEKAIYNEWESLVNMTYSELKNFYESKEGKQAGLSKSEASQLGINSGRESASWILKMKKIPYSEWSEKMWYWAKRQISFIKRMSGNKGDLYDEKGNKTRKHTSLLIWGHNPEKFESGGEVTTNEAFKKWFEGSKVVDNSGKPLVVYHGSPDLRGIKADFVFKTTKERFGIEETYRSYFFTDNYSKAKSYADPKRAFDYQNSEEGVISVYLSLQNPLIVNAFNSIWRKFETTIGETKIVGTRQLIEYAHNKGYDGLIVKNVKDHYSGNDNKKASSGTVYVSFSSNQIKLADGSNTTFDSTSNDIRYEVGGIIPVKYVSDFNSARELSDYIKQPNSLLRLFHATKKGNDLSAGIKPNKNKNSLHSKSGYVYLASSEQRAKGFVSYFHNEVDVYEIEIPANKLQSDKTQIDYVQQYYGNIKNTVADSLFYAGAAKFMGEVLPYMIINKYEMGGIFHGSPHRFDKFSTEYMGSGEGVQAFGWGLYFTELEDIAKAYAKPSIDNDYVVNGVNLRGLIPYNLLIDINTLIQFKHKPELLTAKFEEDTINKLRNFAVNSNNELLYRNFKDVTHFGDLKFSRNLYRVSLHKGKTPEQYSWLEWDKPLNTSKIKDKIINALIHFKVDKNNVMGELSQRKLIEDIDNGAVGEYVYNSIIAYIINAKSQKEVSLFLLKNGIDGIKYPAESIARRATSDTARGFNYVVFDENAVNIEQVQELENGGEVLKVGDYTNLGRIEEEYGYQFKIDGNWYHKKLVHTATKSESPKKSKKIVFKDDDNSEYEYYANCTAYPNLSDLEEIIENAKEILITTFKKKIGDENFREFSAMLGYDKHLRIENDYHVSYYKSKDLNGDTVYYVKHSAIEYIFKAVDKYKQGGQVGYKYNVGDKVSFIGIGGVKFVGVIEYLGAVGMYEVKYRNKGRWTSSMIAEDLLTKEGYVAEKEPENEVLELGIPLKYLTLYEFEELTKNKTEEQIKEIIKNQTI